MCGRLVNLDTVARVLADYYHLKTDTQLAALDEALSRVPAVSVVGGYRKDHVVDPNKMVGDLISRAAVVDTIEGVDWYHINKNGEMVHGANDNDHQAWYKAEDIYKAVESVPSARRWIPCTPETMPKMTDTYLVQVGINENGEGMHTEVRTADWNVVWHEWYVHTTRCFVGDIIKWMPIPWEGR